MPKGNLIIIAAASGTGKTTLARALVSELNNIKISVSHTTRPIRAKEIADQHYFFVSQETFDGMIKQNAFIEHAEVFGYCYGTSKQWLEEQLVAGFDVILDIDWQGAAAIRKLMPCFSIFLLPPSKKELRLRLERRKREAADIIEARLKAASSEIAHYHEFDYLVINDKFDQAINDLKNIVLAERLKKPLQAIKYANLLKELLE
ncbi:MAG: guanylate kinase [Gammaproteobacteria bacterium]|nr:guanylate kinase [Gammaproteobacteria bacterium]